MTLLLGLQLGLHQLTTSASLGLGRGSVAGANASIALGARRFPVDKETSITVWSARKLPPAPLYLRISRRDTESGCYSGRSLSPGDASHWRDCHFADALYPSLLKHLLKVEGGAAE